MGDTPPDLPGAIHQEGAERERRERGEREERERTEFDSISLNSFSVGPGAGADRRGESERRWWMDDVEVFYQRGQKKVRT